MKYKLLTSLVLAGGILLGINQYTRPDLRYRSTQDLRWEVIQIGLDYNYRNPLIRSLPMQRQEFITVELARRLPEELAALERQNQLEEQQLLVEPSLAQR